MALHGSERKVLHSILSEDGADPAGYVSDSLIARATRLPLDEVRDCLETLEGKEYVQRALGVGGQSAYITARGRQELRRSRAVGDVEGQDPAAPVKIVPKGLRCFDEEDKDFFPQLLPGPFRDGVAESIHFWKSLIEKTHQRETFRVGVLYGPSGCGKSSLVKAGLLPRLGDQVTAVYVEATPDDTEARLLKGLRKSCPDLHEVAGLAGSLGPLLTRPTSPAGRKVLLVIDQFEQWLHARRDEADAELVSALRLCDGERLQALLMVRDDFSMALLRFLNRLRVKLEEGTNFAAVDLFDPDHSRSVLVKHGQAYGKFPDDPRQLSEDQEEFLRQAIQGLARDGLVVPVRLALFAEMVKKKPWTPRTLKEVGGTEGIGVTFLEETLGSRSSHPVYRSHEKAARAVLKVLLPEGGTGIKGHMRSQGELLAASGYAGRPEEFADLLGILDGKARLITPTEPADAGADESPGERYYQLTHDYLVPSIREWLVRKQKETRRGRAELRLAECAALWSARPENRLLPSFWEWVRIRSLTRKRDWTEAQRKMMKKAGRVHGVRGLAVVAVTALAAWGAFEAYGSLRASVLVDELVKIDTIEAPAVIGQLQRHRRWAKPLLARLYQESQPGSKGASTRAWHSCRLMLRRSANFINECSRRTQTSSRSSATRCTIIGDNS